MSVHWRVGFSNHLTAAREPFLLKKKKKKKKVPRASDTSWELFKLLYFLSHSISLPSLFPLHPLPKWRSVLANYPWAGHIIDHNYIHVVWFLKTDLWFGLIRQGDLGYLVQWSHRFSYLVREDISALIKHQLWWTGGILLLCFFWEVFWYIFMDKWKECCDQFVMSVMMEYKLIEVDLPYIYILIQSPQFWENHTLLTNMLWGLEGEVGWVPNLLSGFRS